MEGVKGRVQSVAALLPGLVPDAAVGTRGWQRPAYGLYQFAAWHWDSSACRAAGAGQSATGGGA